MTVESLLWEDYRRAVLTYWDNPDDRNKRILDAQYLAFELAFISKSAEPGVRLN